MGKWRNDLDKQVGGPGWPRWPVPFDPKPTNHFIAVLTDLKLLENSVFLSQRVWNLGQNLVKKAPKCGGSPLQHCRWTQPCGFQPSASFPKFADDASAFPHLRSRQTLQTSFYANACRQKWIRRGMCLSPVNHAFITARAACHKWL